MKILIVDDNDDARYILQKTLAACGYEVKEAENGKTALESGHADKPDLVITDILMPVMDGFSMCRIWKNDDHLKEIPLIFYTATYTDSKDEQFALSLGADKFIRKPLQPDLFMKEVNCVLKVIEKKSKPVKKPLIEDESEEYKLYSERLIKKLEDKMLQLEEKNAALENEIIERKRIEYNLRIEEEKYRTLITNIPGMVYRGLSDWSMIVGSNCETVCGYPIEDLISKKINWLDIIHPDDKNKVIKEGNSFDDKKRSIVQEYRIIAKNGSTRWVSDHKTSCFDERGAYVGVDGIVFDITNRKQLEDQNCQLQKLESIGILAGGIAHDFNNTLSVITGNLSYALQNFDKADELYEVLSDVNEGAKKAQHLTQQLLTFSKGGCPLKKAVNINNLIEETAKFVTMGTKSKCNFEFSENIWTTNVDEGQVSQVISNLVINANQAMPSGGIIMIRTKNIAIESDNHESQLPQGKYVNVTIEDQGLGISEEILPKIFNPFYTTKQTGNGLGLSTTHSIIKSHDGHISVYSKLQKGTIFSIFLPASEQPLHLSNTKTTPMLGGSKGKILIMDDQEALLKMARRILGQMGYDVEFARDGVQAIDIYRKTFQSKAPFDFVILDLTIPGGMGGIKTIPELLKINPNAKVFVSSGSSNDPVMADYKSYGFAGVISKPYIIDQMAELFNKVLDEKD